MDGAGSGLSIVYMFNPSSFYEFHLQTDEKTMKIFKEFFGDTFTYHPLLRKSSSIP